MSTPMIGLAPARRAPGDRGVADAAASEHRDAVAAADVAGVHRGAEPGHHAAPEQARRPRAVARRSTLVACPAATSVCSANAPMPSAGVRAACRRRASSSASALNVAKQYHGRPRRHARQVPHTARQLRITKSPGATSVDVGADRLDDARGLVAEQEREVVVDRALPVVQVGVAHAARLDLTRTSPGPGSGTTISRTSTGSTLARARRHPCTVAAAMGLFYRIPCTRRVARTGRWSEPTAGSTACSSTSVPSPGRTRMWSIWLCGRLAGQVRPRTARCQPGRNVPHAGAPEVAVAGHDRGAGPAAGAARRSRRSWMGGP